MIGGSLSEGVGTPFGQLGPQSDWDSGTYPVASNSIFHSEVMW